ncbi:uncharacterized protein LOC106672939 [Cimex lectularius]|uniref:Spaetzle domain-containing protein n=1 Tax=Cimex lectularius TaxID=79782 RepID=A0A8I6S775_CIMLE|nr:uncharacterized protein LOC106672939 [Cimex lectularius]XP_014260262.1 uncharacterized protein LOC106672939 [Cimex lectularius]XP_014260263.1 uncharacterized protein LOC106672939 [Cimex lectularius]XP_014260264.1 uncharacterized protein LOC106672939 [Cimex lectularius]XP_014260267.1 uncharacterized protein LOC106672939 [Cimex lectularius]XP_014260269.1 uncharacterized protein LOC106672939 [Cimex lectularius]XP_014260273.1 uncharacterized protein LOC106672939 [Cimex lectularius]
MRIAIHIIFIAVVSLAACAVGWQRGTRFSNSNESAYDWSSNEGEETTVSGESTNNWLSVKESQKLLKKERGLPVDCCPYDVEMIEPKGGTNQEGMYVELYMEGENKQRFFEQSCRLGVEGKPCRFIDRKLYNQSRCVQRYSYTYAIIKLPDETIRHHHRVSHFTSFPSANSKWMLDYIKVRNGCSCEVLAKMKKKKKKGGKGKRESEEPH